jgi:two-component system, LuxR family, response regulator FixJ
MSRTSAMDSRNSHIFFVDNEPGIRTAVQRTLETSGMRVSVFASAEECLTRLSEQTCDVLITDLRMEGMDGMSLLCEVKRSLPWLPTIIVTGYGDIPLATAAIRAGAVEFLEKPLDQQGLLTAIRRALKSAVRPEARLPGRLSAIELQVLHSVFAGKTSREIARSFNRSVRTIEAHRRSIMVKFGAKNIAQLIQRATALGFGGNESDTSERPGVTGTPHVE